MQEARARFAIDVDLIGVGDNAKLSKIKMRIYGLQRIEGPGHSVGEIVGQNLFPLCKLQTKCKVVISVGGEHRQHVRVVYDAPAHVTVKAIHKTNHLFAVESSDQTPANLKRCRKLIERN